MSQLTKKPQRILTDFQGFLVQMTEKMQARRMPSLQAVFNQSFPRINKRRRPAAKRRGVGALWLSGGFLSLVQPVYIIKFVHYAEDAVVGEQIVHEIPAVEASVRKAGKAKGSLNFHSFPCFPIVKTSCYRFQYTVY